MQLSPQRPKIHIVGHGSLVYSLFKNLGYETQPFTFNHKFTKDDYVVWTGGSDINPALYGQKPHKHTSFAPMRDEYESTVYWSLAAEVPKIGICRGGQLLNVLSGGSLWQHVDGHSGHHIAYDLRTDEPFMVTSVHHQMMKPASDAIILAEAHKCKWKEDAIAKYKQIESDPEVVFYPKTNSFCFQPHPEYGMASCQQWFGKAIKDIFEHGVLAKKA